MKNTASLLFACMVIAAASCKKDAAQTEKPTTQQSKKLYPVTFKLSQFSTDVKPLGMKTSDLKDQIKYLHYSAFMDNIHNEDYVDPEYEYHPINQVADSTANFGTIKDSLPAGDYIVIFAGGNTSPFTAIYYDDLRGYHAGAVSQSFPFGDCFGGGMSIHVGDSVINKEVVLKRMVSKITVKITDALPANAAKFVLTVDNMAPIVFPANQRTPADHGFPFGERYINYPVDAADIGKKDFAVSAYVYEGNLGFVITCYDKNGQIIANKILPNVPEMFINVNKQYNFSGKLFENNSSFQISIDDQWGESEDIPFGYHSDKSIK
ncbi:hypothetical protein GS399_16685 [Pedobacter sp. HMF7647]|uniref:DUF5119 domain-containing protein n=1 Tax=Hufsiella arboris TaxID=2695275 RepID=A0A7K1YDF2_9SPHI|nr:FimB/Mfa2 family fimbrial subunit [Hufsiella arboris]MXV52612.1 hypothetical protein [Hufsiella arboris]